MEWLYLYQKSPPKAIKLPFCYWIVTRFLNRQAGFLYISKLQRFISVIAKRLTRNEHKQHSHAVLVYRYSKGCMLHIQNRWASCSFIPLVLKLAISFLQDKIKKRFLYVCPTFLGVKHYKDMFFAWTWRSFPRVFFTFTRHFVQKIRVNGNIYVHQGWLFHQLSHQVPKHTWFDTQWIRNRTYCNASSKTKPLHRRPPPLPKSWDIRGKWPFTA